MIAVNIAMTLVILLAGAAAQTPNNSDTVSVAPKDTGVALVNPDMGWTMHFYSDSINKYGAKMETTDTLDDFPGVSTVYLRLPWSLIEPEEGKFNWALFDTPAQRWISKGKRVGLRLTCSENFMRFATPEWVKNAGAKGTFCTFGKGPDPKGSFWDPDFGDPIFLKKLDKVLAAMSARYDGNPNVSFVDIGTYGLWGEGHTFMSSRVPDNIADKIIRTHIDMHVKYFPHTLLCISDDIVGHNKPGKRFPLTDYALSKGVSLRDDSILVKATPLPWHHSEMAQAFWPKLPVILEHEHYGASKERGAWGNGSLLLKAIEDYHASYMSIHWWPRVELEENRELIDRINLRMGYRLQLREITWPRQIKAANRFTLISKWANVGVAPCYPGGFMAITLKDGKGGIASLLTDEGLDMRNLKVGRPGQAPVTTQESSFIAGQVVPALKAGNYDIYVSIGRRDGTPVIALPLNGDDGQRRYRLGSVEVLGK